jgi:hypothetical protein
MRSWKLVLAAGLMLAVAACGKPTKEAMLQKVGDPKKKAEVVALLGQPDEIGKLGPIEMWTYRASNGSVVFTMLADNVTLIASMEQNKKQR